MFEDQGSTHVFVWEAKRTMQEKQFFMTWSWWNWVLQGLTNDKEHQEIVKLKLKNVNSLQWQDQKNQKLCTTYSEHKAPKDDDETTWHKWCSQRKWKLQKWNKVD